MGINKCLTVLMGLALLAACSSRSLPKVDSAAEIYHNAPMPLKGAAIGAAGGAATGYALSGGSVVPIAAVAGAALGGVIGTYLDKHRTVEEKLASRHVKVIRAGDYVKLVIPSSQLFVDMSGQLTSSAVGTLDVVLKLIRPFSKIAVSVSAYSYLSHSSAEIDKHLTDLQAQAVSNYLWSHNLGARLIYAKGYGSLAPVTYDLSREDENYRVEITLRTLSASVG